MNSVPKAVIALALTAALYGCHSPASESGAQLPSGVPHSEKVVAPAGADPASVAAGGSGMPVPGSPASGGKVLVDAPADSTGASTGGSGMPIPSNK